MKLLSITLMTLLLSMGAWSEKNWFLFATSNSGKGGMYIDIESIEAKGDYLYAWVLEDFSQEDENGIFSSTALWEWSCEMTDRYKIIHINLWKLPMAAGELEDSWTTALDAPSNTIITNQLNEVCKYYEP